MSAIHEINQIVKQAQNLALNQYMRMSNDDRKAVYDELVKMYGAKSYIRGVDARSKLHRGFMDLFESDREKENAAAARRADAVAAREAEARAAAQAKKIEQHVSAKPRRSAGTWHAPQISSVASSPSQARTQRPSGVTGLGSSIDKSFAELAKATGNSLLGSGGKVEFSSGGLFGGMR